MGTIIYKPHCAKCGALINDEVGYHKRITIEHNMGNYLNREPYDIQPNRCKVCGEYFSTIEIRHPTELEEITYI
jgi:hypothetical protein